ncbi:MAG: sigma-70 family RNA polymerase sigma factor [Pseudomonadota bacterium]
MILILFSVLAAARSRVHDGNLDPATLAAFHAGDTGVLASLFTQHAARARAVVARRLPLCDADAAVQDAFVALLGSEAQRRRFEGGSFAAYLCTIARYRGIDGWRREQRYTDAEAAPEPVDAHSAVDERLAARELLAKFLERSVPPRQKAFFSARFLEQQTQEEAALSLGIKRSTLATWEKQLTERLRRAVLKGEITYVAQHREEDGLAPSRKGVT